MIASANTAAKVCVLVRVNVHVNVLRKNHEEAGAFGAPLAPASQAIILETYPRDELFQTAPDELLRTATGILHLGERQRFRLFVRRDPFERFLVCLIYAPRENYTTELREKWQAILLEELDRVKPRFSLVIVDACRDNPFRDTFKVSATGLAQMSGPSGTLIAYATAPGATAC